MMARIEAIAYSLPERIVTNEDLARENPAWNMGSTQDKSGVTSRHVAAPGETALDLAQRSCDQLFSGLAEGKSAVDAIIFCTQSPDYIMPPNAHLLHQYLRLPDEVIAFDFNLACSGYVYGLAIAGSLIECGLAKKALLVNADTYSRYIHPRDRSCRVLFGDGAAATLLSGAGPGGFLGFELASHGSGFDKFYIPAGGLRRPQSQDTLVESVDRSGNVRTPEHIQMDGFGVWSFINSVVPRQIRALLSKTGLTIPDIDQFIFHQASRMTLDSLVKILSLDGAKVFRNYSEIGNTVSASIPIALKDAIDGGRVKSGDRILLSGFGVGLSYGSTILDYR
jgi:3-oxoacyl-[acyl-carrier-protein] synthase-3